MYVCICHAVTDSEVHEALDAGANTLAEVNAVTSAGGSCATCHDGLEDLIEQRCGTCPLVCSPSQMQVA